YSACQARGERYPRRSAMNLPPCSLCSLPPRRGAGTFGRPGGTDKEVTMIRALAFFLVLVLVGSFALLNWDAFSALIPLSLGLTTVQAPLGLIMLGLVAFLCVLFTVWVISLQAASLMDARRQTRELQAQ